jgi:hypothetical protein
LRRIKKYLQDFNFEEIDAEIIKSIES